MIAKNADDARNNGGSPTACINMLIIYLIFIIFYIIIFFLIYKMHPEKEFLEDTLEEYIALGLEAPFNRETLNS